MTKKLKFKQGDDFKMEFTITEENHTVAIDAKAVLDASVIALNVLEAADPQDEVAIADAEATVFVNNAAYQAAILLDITGWTVSSQLRWCGRLIETFDIDLTDANIGKFIISKNSTATALWVPRKYDMDIQFNRASGKISSETFTIEVEKDVTNV